MSSSSLMALIVRYQQAVTSLTARLRDELGVGDLFHAFRRREIQRYGEFGDEGEYLFHGIGCTIDDGAVCVSFDFYDDGQIDGFDAWRLHRFASDNNGVADSDLDIAPTAIERELRSLVDAGELAVIPGSSLFKLRPALVLNDTERPL